MEFPYYKQLDSMDCGTTCLYKKVKSSELTNELHALLPRSLLCQLKPWRRLAPHALSLAQNHYWQV